MFVGLQEVKTFATEVTNMRPLLAHIYEPHRVTYPCYVQPKLNGIRALYQNGAFQSRDEIPFPKGLLDHLTKPLLETFSPEIILDGELYVHGWALQKINAAVTPVRQTPTEDTVKVEYHVFDVVDFGKSFKERMAQRQMPLFDKDPIYRVQTIPCGTETLANELYAKCVVSGYEGMMYRLGDCPYTAPKQLITHDPNATFLRVPFSTSKFLSDKSNRCWHLLKRKDWRDDEFECVGVQEGEGKYVGTLGALLCQPLTIQLPKPIARAEARRFHVGSGLTDAERDHYWANPPIGRLVKVKYLVLSNAGIPLNPTILCIL